MALDPALRARGRGGVRIRTNEQILFNPLCFSSVEELLAGLSSGDWFQTLFDRVEVVYRPMWEGTLADRMLFVREYGTVQLCDGHVLITSGNVYTALGLLQFWRRMVDEGMVPAEPLLG